MWNYVITAQKPTSVSHCLTGNFTSPSELNLIIAKWTRIEIFTVNNEGLSPLHDVPLFGRVASMELFRAPGEQQDSLFILTEKHQFCLLSYDTTKKAILTRANGDLQDINGREASVGSLFAFDPESRMVAVHIYDGSVKVIPYVEGTFRDAINTPLNEIELLDMKCLAGCSHPTLAVLYQDSKEAKHLKTYEIVGSAKDIDLKEGGLTRANLDVGANMLISVPHPYGTLQ